MGITPQPKIDACLSDQRILPLYMTSTNARRIMVGGIGPDGEARCFWTEDDKVAGLVVTSLAWKLCGQEAVECIVLVVGEKFRGPTPVPHNASAASNGATISTVWYLLGQFAAGFSMGHAATAHVQSITPRVDTARANSLFHRQPAGYLMNGAPPNVCRIR
jgi:hypothetical protein